MGGDVCVIEHVCVCGDVFVILCIKLLIIHHVQQMWDAGLRNKGTSFDEVLWNVYLHIKQNDYDHVIVTNFEAGQMLDNEQAILGEFYPAVYDYCYGWTRADVEDYYDGFDFCDGGGHSEVVLVEDWMRELKGKDVYLCGAFDGECIEDMEYALRSAGVAYKRLNDLII